MSTICQIVDAAGTVWVDFNDPTGAANPNGLRTFFAREGAVNLGVPAPTFTVLERTTDGGEIVQSHNGLLTMAFRMRVEAATASAVVLGLGEVGRILSEGGRRIKFTPDGNDPVFIPFERSPHLQALVGQQLGLTLLDHDSRVVDVDVVINRQPWAEGSELLGSVNLLKNGLLLHDFAAVAGRPDSWTWDSTTGISAESVVSTPWAECYQFTIADAGVHNLQQTTAVGTVAPGDVTPMAFDAHVLAVGGTPQVRCMIEYMQSDGTTQVGADQTTTITTLTTAWQRVTLTPAAAGALTSRVRASIQVDNVTATSVTIQFRRAQVEVGAAPTSFRAGPETVAYDPASTANPPRMITVYNPGNAPTLARIRATADSSTLGRLKCYRVSYRDGNVPVDVLKSTLFKQLESGTLGTDTTSTADGNASGGNAANVNFTPVTPSLRADSAGGGTGNTITITEPAGTAVGDVLHCTIWRADATTVIAAPEGWQLVGSQANVANTFGTTCVRWDWYKVATADEPTDYTFTVAFDAAGARSYRYWMGALIGIDNNTPLDVYAFSSENNTTAATAATITTTADNAFIITSYGGLNSAGSLSFTAPAGSTPTYTEQDDGTADVTYRGMAVYTGVLSTAGATGTKDSTAAILIDAVMLNVAYRQAPAALETRSTVTFTSLQPGTYRAWIRCYPTAASKMRLRLGWAPMASPSAWTDLEDYVLDATGASSFAYLDHDFGPIEIPPDYTVSTLTVRLQAGLELTSTADLRADVLCLAPAFEHVGTITSPSVAGTSEVLLSDAATSQVLHLDSSGNVEEHAQADGPVLVELQPGVNLLYFTFQQAAATGFVDRLAALGAVPTIRVDLTPRYR